MSTMGLLLFKILTAHVLWRLIFGVLGRLALPSHLVNVSGSLAVSIINSIGVHICPDYGSAMIIWCLKRWLKVEETKQSKNHKN